MTTAATPSKSTTKSNGKAPTATPVVTAAESAPAPARNAKRPPIPRARRIERSVKHVQARLARVKRIAGGWTAEMGRTISVAEEALSKVFEHAAQLPDDFAPARKSTSPYKPVAIGQTVDLTEKACAAYKDLIEPGEMKGLVVRKIAEKKLFLRTVGGSTIVLARKEVTPRESTTHAS